MARSWPTGAARPGCAKPTSPTWSRRSSRRLASSLPQFRGGGPEGCFRGWLRGIARHKIQDHFRLRVEPAAGGTDAHRRLQQVPGPAAEVDLSEGTAEIHALYRRALDQVRWHFEERTWTAFWLVAVENRTPADVAAEMGLTPNAVRQAKGCASSGASRR